MSRNFVKNCRKIIGSGLNYKSALEASKTLKPENPIIFFKPISTLLPEGSDAGNFVEIPKAFDSINYEAEVGVIIGHSGKHIEPSAALKHVGGFCLALDMSAGSEFLTQMDSPPFIMPWCLGKAFDRSTPVSRFISPIEVKDPNDIRIWSEINGELRQDDSTKNLIFSISELISFLSRHITLEVDDLILTGTPLGDGPVHHGDTIKCGFSNIVEMSFRVKKEE